jgi:predicted protein tyrosine phosphatase
MNVLFVCTYGEQRSVKAARLYEAAHPEDEVKTAGTAFSARTPVTHAAIGWADHVVVMEERHAADITARDDDADVIVLGVSEGASRDDVEDAMREACSFYER